MNKDTYLAPMRPHEYLEKVTRFSKDQERVPGLEESGFYPTGHGSPGGRELSYLTFPLSLLSFGSRWRPGWYTTLIPDTIFLYQDPFPDPHTTGNLILIFAQSVSCFSVFLKLQQISQELCRAYQAALHPPTIC